MRRLVLALVLACVPVSAALAQTRFSEAEARARPVEVTEAGFADAVAPLLADCRTAGSASAIRSCVTGRRRTGRTQLRATYLLELPGASHLRFGSYEAASGGFRIALEGLVLRRASAPGVLATAPTLGGRLPHGHVAKLGFARVASADAAPWLATHAPSDFEIRLLVRIGDDFADEAAPDPAARYGVRIEVLGMQIYGVRSGDVLVDTYADLLPPPLARLEERTRLFAHDATHEGLFLASEGTEVVLDAALLERSPGETATHAALIQTVGATRTELLRMTAPCCTASIDVRRHGPTKILAILTEQAPAPGAPGRGRVVLFTWNREAARFENAAEWEGANGSAPPAWVLDPGVDP